MAEPEPTNTEQQSHVTIRIDGERVDSLIHTLEDFSDLATMEQREDLALLHKKLMEGASDA